MTTDVPVGEMETRELAVAIYHLKEHRSVVSRDIWTYQEELKRRMTDLDVEALPDSDYDIRLERGGSPTYDTNLLQAKLGELLTPEEMAELIEEVPASQKVSGRSARSLSLKYKGRVADTILAARMNPEPRVVVKQKKSGVELQ
jgi:hypothetical protein